MLLPRSLSLVRSGSLLVSIAWLSLTCRTYTPVTVAPPTIIHIWRFRPMKLPEFRSKLWVASTLAFPRWPEWKYERNAVRRSTAGVWLNFGNGGRCAKYVFKELNGEKKMCFYPGINGKTGIVVVLVIFLWIFLRVGSSLKVKTQKLKLFFIRSRLYTAIAQVKRNTLTFCDNMPRFYPTDNTNMSDTRI